MTKYQTIFLVSLLLPPVGFSKSKVLVPDRNIQDAATKPTKSRNKAKHPIPKRNSWKVVATVMTSKTGGKRLAGGEPNNANVASFVALPAARALGRTVSVHCLDTNITIEDIPVRDIGPHSINDPYWERDGVPLAMRGKSDKYRRAKNTAGIDLSLKLSKQFGLRYPYKGTVVWWFDDQLDSKQRRKLLALSQNHNKQEAL